MHAHLAWLCQVVLLLLSSWHAFGEDDDDDASCPIGNAKTSDTFWAAAKQQGLLVRLADAEGAAVGKVLSEPVFYGRPILRIPQRVLLRPETITDLQVRRAFLKCIREHSSGVSPARTLLKPEAAEVQQRMELASALILERRNTDSFYLSWLNTVADVRSQVPVLNLGERHLRALQGTSAEEFHTEVNRQKTLIKSIASACPAAFSDQGATEDEAAWSLSVVLRHGQTIRPGAVNSTDGASEGLALLPLTELVSCQFHPDPAVAVGMHADHKGAIVQRTQRDMRQNEEVLLWTGRMSSSEAALRFGVHFTGNPLGIGGNVSRPPNWSGNMKAPNMREFAKFNCTSLNVFEMRLNPKGWPNRIFVRCWRLAWHMERGWYSDSYLSRVSDLDKWPPPPKYEHQDWLYWTQADREVNKVILAYCQNMKRQLRESISAATANDFRASSDPLDKLVWQVRSDESRAFQKCTDLARSHSLDMVTES